MKRTYKRTFHLPCTPSDVSSRVLLTHDFQTGEIIHRCLTSINFTAEKGQFSVVTGEHKGVPITVVSCGIGSPTTAMAVEELHEFGVRHIIKVGTCVSLLKDPIGQLIFPTGAVRSEGTSGRYCRPEYPAVADQNLLGSLREATKKKREVATIGVIWTEDDYYCLLKDPDAFRRFSYWQQRFVVAAEMECSALFVVGSLRGIKTAAALVVNRTFPELKRAAAGKKVRWRTDIENRVKIAAGLSIAALCATTGG